MRRAGRVAGRYAERRAESDDDELQLPERTHSTHHRLDEIETESLSRRVNEILH
jgi:hypothetical protein